MTALIMAGGYATRMYPLTRNMPKALLPVDGKPVIEWITDDIASVPQIKKTVVVTNKKFEDMMCTWSMAKQNVEVLATESCIRETCRGAIADAVWAVEQLDIHDDILIAAADNLLEESIRTLVECFVAHEKRNICVYSYRETCRERLSLTGVADIQDGEITHFAEKPADPQYENAIPPYYIYPEKLFPLVREALEEGCCPDSPGYMIEWLHTRVPIKAIELKGKRFNCGSLDSYEYARTGYRGIIYE